MEGIRAAINLDSYFIENIDFKVNPNYESENDNISLDISFDSKISISESNKKANVNIYCSIFEDKKNVPFNLNISIMGNFTYESEIMTEEIEKLITTNATAILFPYLRAMITNITVNSGLPAVIIPTINVNRLLNI